MMNKPVLSGVTLQHRIGHGAMGDIWKGTQEYIDRTVAVKFIHPEILQENDLALKRFQREAKILASLQHPHIVSCYQAGLTDDQVPYLMMEFIDGPDLAHYVQKHGALGAKQATRLILAMAQAPQSAHQHHIIHRDIKPANILLQSHQTESEIDLQFLPRKIG